MFKICPMVRELLPPETGLAFEAMRALRPRYDDRDAWVQRIDELQRRLSLGHARNVSSEAPLAVPPSGRLALPAVRLN